MPRGGDHVEQRHTREVQCQWRNAASTAKAWCRQRSGNRREAWKSRKTAVASHVARDDVPSSSKEEFGCGWDANGASDASGLTRGKF